MTVRDVCDAVDRLAPPGFAYSWDKTGLNIGDPSASCSGVLVALTVSRTALKVARQRRAQLIVSHHPVIWNPIRALRTDDPHTALCLEIAQAGIACFSAHTNLDVVPGGVNYAIAKQLGLGRCEPLLGAPTAGQVKLVTFVPESHLDAVRSAVCNSGAGVIGDYTYCSFSAGGVGTFLPGAEAKPFSGKKLRVNEEPERRFEVLLPRARLADVIQAMRSAHPYEEPAFDIVVLENTDSSVGLGVRATLDKGRTLESYARHVCAALRLTHVRFVGDGRKKVRTVGIIGGAGGGELEQIPDDIDMVITGDVSYHHALAAEERGLAVIDAGHSGMEKWVVPALGDFLRMTLPGLRVHEYMEPDVFRCVTA